HGLATQAVEGWPTRLPAAGSEPMVAVLPLSGGFVLGENGLTVLSDGELSGERARPGQRRRAAARDPETILRDLTDLAIGAPVVHEDHGVGRYQGLTSLDAGGVASEYLAIEYAG